MTKIVFAILIIVLSGCARDMQEKTLEMTKQQKRLNGMCEENPKSTLNKFTGSRSTMMMECKISTGINSNEMQKILLHHGWTEKQRNEKSILYCLMDTGIALVTSLDNETQKIKTTMQYPSASCGSAFSIY